ncbi:MAG: ABC transporter ATP-binding protein [Burkholderiaceae bacterium]|nr:ABC transporter ATP-binding protein [Burkholderiaceae bacterium]
MTGSVLRARDVRMQFGGVLALDGAAVEVRPGEVVGLIGRNGSGKSTLFNCITGFLRPTAGSITLDAQSIEGRAPHDIVRAGVVRTFQTPRVDYRATVRDAVLCGLYPRASCNFISNMLGLPASLAQEKSLQHQADAVIGQLDMQAWAGMAIGKLSMGRVRMVEVARAMASSPRYLLLDEPAAGLSRNEQAVLSREIRKLADAGIGVLLVEHNFSLIRMLCDRVTVLDSGRVLLNATPQEVERDEQVLRLYLGAAGDTVATAETPQP